MKLIVNKAYWFFLLSIFTINLYPINAVATINFTRENLELVERACLAGRRFKAEVNANGNLSIEKLEGNGRFQINKEDLSIVDLPDASKQQEFNEIRSCIQDYFLKDYKNNNETQNSSATIQKPSSDIIGLLKIGKPLNGKVIQGKRVHPVVLTIEEKDSSGFTGKIEYVNLNATKSIIGSINGIAINFNEIGLISPMDKRTNAYVGIVYELKFSPEENQFKGTWSFNDNYGEVAINLR